MVARAGGIDLRMGAIHYGAHHEGRGVCVRTALAAAGKRCGADEAAADVLRRKSAGAFARGDPGKQSHRRMRKDLPDLEYSGHLEKRREHAKCGSADYYGRPAAPSGERAADGAGTRAARGFTPGGSENHFVAEQCV